MSSAADQALVPTAALDSSGRSFVAFCRWASALLVMLSHLRGTVFIGWRNLEPAARNLLFLPLYGVTQFYHEAVLVFFVLSGFLIAGPGLDRVRSSTFSPTSYAIDRFTRIYVTAFPAMLLTLGADWVGRTLFPWTGFYDGTNDQLWEHLGGRFSDSIGDLLSNLAMLQPTRAATLGSNTPLWSLSLEVWFYVWFGVVAWALQSRRPSSFLLVATATLGLLLFHWTALAYLSIWSFGALAYQWSGWPRSMRMALLFFAASMLLSMRAGFVAHEVPLKPTDIPVGLGFAWVVALMKRRSYRFLARSERFNQALSSFSYSLYVVHNPTLLVLVAGFIGAAGLTAQIKHGYAPTALSFGICLITAASTLLVAFVFSRIFEARTASVRSWLKRLSFGPRTG